MRILLTSALFAAALAAAAQELPLPATIDLPEMGEPADLAMSPAQEKALGRKVVAEMYRYQYILEDAELAEYISALGWKIAGAYEGSRPELNFLTIADARINAFALPGGFIGVNAGLLLAADSESEVAGVLGHELVHVTQRHIARSQDEGRAASIATWATVLAAILAGSGNPDVIIGALSLGQAVSYERQAAYTRAHEQEADRIGIQIMAAAGFAPEGMASFFGKLEQQARLYGSGVPEILRTHPLNTNRMAEARARAAALNRPAPKDAPDFLILKARTQVLAADNATEAVEYSAAKLAAQDTPAHRYGHAFALSERGQYADALAALEPALDALPRQVNLRLLQGRLELALGDQKTGLATLAKTLAQYPRYPPALFSYADALITAGRAEQARQVLISSEQALGTRLATYNLLAQAAKAMDQHAEASFQTATYLYLRGDAGSALAAIDAGLRVAEISKQDRARLTAKRQEIRESLPKNWRPPLETERPFTSP